MLTTWSRFAQSCAVKLRGVRWEGVFLLLCFVLLAVVQAMFATQPLPHPTPLLAIGPTTGDYVLPHAPRLRQPRAVPSGAGHCRSRACVFVPVSARKPWAGQKGQLGGVQGVAQYECASACLRLLRLWVYHCTSQCPSSTTTTTSTINNNNNLNKRKCFSLLLAAVWGSAHFDLHGRGGPWH